MDKMPKASHQVIYALKRNNVFKYDFVTNRAKNSLSV